MIIPHVMARTLLKELFLALYRLPAYYALNNLANLPCLSDLLFFFATPQILSNINNRVLNILFDCIINLPEEKKPI